MIAAALPRVPTGAGHTGQAKVVHRLWSSAAVLPELMKPVVELPVIKAAALKFLTTFRNQLPKPVVVQVLVQRTPGVMAYAVRAAMLSACTCQATRRPAAQ